MPDATGNGPRLTIDTSDGEPPAPVPDRRGPNGTPRSSTSWFASTAPDGQPSRSWLQSPRIWGQGHTPKNGGKGRGDLTPTSQRKAAYFAATLPQQQKDAAALFGREEDEDGDGEHRPQPQAQPQPQQPAAAVNLASVVQQTGKDGRYQAPQQQQQQQQQQEAPTAPPASSSTSDSSSPSPSPSFLGRLVGRFMQQLSTSSSSSSPSSPSTPSSRRQQPRQGLLGPPHPDDQGKRVLVLDLDETLVHSSFQPVDGADFTVRIRIEETWHTVYVTKRPGVDAFLERVSSQYEVVVFTASLRLYADPLLEILDKKRVVRHRLYREDCTFTQGAYLKDLTRLGRELAHSILVDNSPLSIAQPENAILCSSFIDDPADRELEVIVAFLEDIANCSDVRPHCPRWREWEKKEPGARHHHHHHHRHQGKAGKGKGEGEGKAKGVQAG